MNQKNKGKMEGKSNLLILLGIAVIAIGIMYAYVHPSEKENAGTELTDSEVNEILLLESIEKNITVTEQELQSAYYGLMNKSGMDQEEYDAYVKTRHESKEAFMQYLSQNLQILKLINEEIDWSQISISDADIDGYIAENPNIFPVAQLNEPGFKETFYSAARQQMFEKQRQELIEKYVRELVGRYQEKANPGQ